MRKIWKKQRIKKTEGAKKTDATQPSKDSGKETNFDQLAVRKIPTGTVVTSCDAFAATNHSWQLAPVVTPSHLMQPLPGQVVSAQKIAAQDNDAHAKKTDATQPSRNSGKSTNFDQLADLIPTGTVVTSEPVDGQVVDDQERQLASVVTPSHPLVEQVVDGKQETDQIKLSPQQG